MEVIDDLKSQPENRKSSKPSDDKAGVVAAKAERIAQGEVDFCLAGLQRHIIHLQVASLVLIV
jgi:hypothetical protein